jgi:CRP-like cAMP-binding protein
MAERLDGSRLATLRLLDGVDPQLLEPIAASMGLRRADRGEVLSREGEPGDTFWLVLEGRVRVTLGRRWLADAGPGSILGELSLLRHQPRTATVTATTAALLATGDDAVLQKLLDIPLVRARVRRLVSARLAHDLKPIRHILADGSTVLIRPLFPEDRDAYDDAVHRLSADSLRKRFFSAAGPSQALIDFLVDVDYVDHFAWMAFSADDPQTGLAVVRYVRAPESDEAEVAFGTVDSHQGRGIGTFLFGAIGVAACEAGLKRLVAYVLEDNTAMRKVLAKAHPVTRFAEPGVVEFAIDPSAAASLLDPAARNQLARAVHDIVTAATLALAPPS